MNDQELAHAVAAELGEDVLAAVEAPQPDDATRAFGIPEAMVIGGFVISCAQFAMSIWQARQDRALLVEALVNSEELMRVYPQLDPEKRLGFMARVVNKLVPDSFARLAQDHSPPSMADKQRWIEDYLKSRRARGGGSGEFAARDFQGGAVILVPFADQNYWIVYKNIGWTPDDEDGPGVVPVDVPKGFVADLASVPNYLWAVLQKTGRYGNAAIYHDWLYWEQTCPREVADRVFDDLVSAFELLATHPTVGHIREDLAPRPWRFWSVGPSLIAYRGDVDPIWIARVARGERRWEDIRLEDPDGEEDS